jgi:hypothetical protein
MGDCVEWLECAGQIPEREVAISGCTDKAHRRGFYQKVRLGQTVGRVSAGSQKSEVLLVRWRKVEDLTRR